MSMRIRIKAESATEEAELNETLTAKMLWDALPVEGFANTWGEEVYFKIPVDAEPEENAREVMDKGEIAYWPMGQAFCIFYGPTPASRGDEIRAYSPVNVLGRIVGEPTVFQNVKDGERIALEKTE
jgi:hypothetical protein